MDINDWKVIGFVSAPVIGLYAWFLKHVTGSSRHPKADDLVYSDVCLERGKANTQEHSHLQADIVAAIARSDEQHRELKMDMKSGFTEIKDLIRANGH